MNEKLCVVIPVYNEREAIGGVLKKWSATLDALGIDYTIRPYNDGSKDDSLAVMQRVAKNLPNVEVYDKPNGGHGSTILQGYREASADGFDWVFQIDSDDEMGPESFAALWERRGDYDFLVGRRHGRKQALPRKMVSFVSRLAVRLFYGKGDIWDVNAPYRLMRVSALSNVFTAIPANTFAPNVIITGMVARLNLRACEMPVPQHDRTTGEVSIKKWKLLKAAAKSLWQTIWFARPIVPIVALIPFGLTLATINLTTCMWYDELAMCDGVFMKALHGLSWSGVWACSYNPLYPVSLVAWVKLFGASHFAVCSFTIVLGYITTLVIARIAHRRNWWHGTMADIAFVALFWGFGNFAWILTNARVDVLVLLLCTLFVDALADSKNKLGGMRVYLWSTLLFLAAPYILPLLFFFGVYLLIITKETKHRKMIFLRGMITAGGFITGFLLTATYYFLQHDLIRLLGSYVYFNTLTGYNPDPFFLRIVKGYLFDHHALFLLIAALIFGAWKKRFLRMALFISLIPLFMIVGGRYEVYYSWVFYVPAVVLFVSALFERRKIIIAVVAIIASILCLIHPFQRINSNKAALKNQDACREYVNKNADLIQDTSDVVVAADLSGNTGFYYPLSRLGVRIWYRGPEMLNGRTDEEKFNEGLSFIAKTKEQTEELRTFIAKIQRFMPLLPDNGLAMFYSKSDADNIKPLFESKGYVLSLLNTENGFSIWKLEHKPTP